MHHRAFTCLLHTCAQVNTAGSAPDLHDFTGKATVQLDWVLVRGFRARSFLTDDRIDGVLPSDLPLVVELDWPSLNSRGGRGYGGGCRDNSRYAPGAGCAPGRCGRRRQGTRQPSISPSPASDRAVAKPIAAAIVASTSSTTTATRPAPGGPGRQTACWVSRLSSLIVCTPWNLPH